MLSMLSVFGLIGGASLACYAPRTSRAYELDVIGATMVIAALFLIGVRLASIGCLS